MDAITRKNIWKWSLSLIILVWVLGYIMAQVKHLSVFDRKNPNERMMETDNSIVRVVKDDLEYVLKDHPDIFIERVYTMGKSLVIVAALDRYEMLEFYQDLGTIHGSVVGSDPPDIDNVIIEDTGVGGGQRIIIDYPTMRNFSQKRISWQQYRNSWIIEKISDKE